MGHAYAGADSFPTDYTIPDDGDARTAASVDVAFEALGDRTIYLKNRLAALGAVHDFTAVGTTTFTAGPYDKGALIELCGGGGGGAGGGFGSTLALHSGCGGGGGAGAPLIRMFVPLTPGTTYDVTVGDGGAGGAGSTALNTAADGQAGHTSSVRVTGGGAFLAVGFGGGPGTAYDHADLITDLDNDPQFAIAAGGSSASTSNADGYRRTGLLGTTAGGAITLNKLPFGYALGPGDGGDGTSRQMLGAGHRGRSSIQGLNAGAGGIGGTIDGGTVQGGGGGGGGGSGPFTDNGNTCPGISGDNTNTGGAGGNGGNGSGASPGTNGAAGSIGLGTSGGGGGGGGAGGSSLVTPGNGGPGAQGGSGRVRITIVGVG
jgi:hypothetical protein